MVGNTYCKTIFVLMSFTGLLISSALWAQEIQTTTNQQPVHEISCTIGDTGNIVVHPDFYEYSTPGSGVRNILTIDKNTLKTTAHTWTGRQVFPLDSKQTQALLVFTDEERGAMISLVDQSLKVKRKWLIDANIFRVDQGGRFLYLFEQPFESPKAIWAIDPDKPGISKLIACVRSECFYGRLE